MISSPCHLTEIMAISTMFEFKSDGKRKHYLCRLKITRNHYLQATFTKDKNRSNVGWFSVRSVRDDRHADSVALKQDDLLRILQFVNGIGTSFFDTGNGPVKLMWIAGSLLITSYLRFPRSVRIPPQLLPIFCTMIRSAVMTMEQPF